LVDRRLQDRAGIDLASNPERAATYLGPHLRELLIERLDMRAETRDIAVLVDEVEAI
jgi:hypothetical protein